MPLEDHEFAVRLIERFILILIVELGMNLKTMGSTTLDRERLDRSAEPDNAYYIQNREQVAGRNVDLESHFLNQKIKKNPHLGGEIAFGWVNGINCRFVR